MHRMPKDDQSSEYNYRQRNLHLTICVSRSLQCKASPVAVACCSSSHLCGKAEVNLMEVVRGVDYVKFQHVLATQASREASSSPALTKNELRQLLSLAQSDRERELVRYTTFRASGLSATGARRHYGLDNMTERSARVEQEAECIRESIEELAQVQVQVASRSVRLFGLTLILPKVALTMMIKMKTMSLKFHLHS